MRILMNAFVCDKSLTFAARGALFFLLATLDPDEPILLEHLRSGSPAGALAVKSIVRELVEAGHIERNPKRDAGRNIGHYWFSEKLKTVIVLPPSPSEPTP